MTAIAGDHRLTLVAKTGSRAGQRVSGTLHIDAPSAGKSVDSLSGTSAIDLVAVGATAPGSRGGAEVVVTEWMTTSGGVSAPQIALRFGRIPAPDGGRAIEGPHMALFVNAVTSEGFSGSWNSGTADPMAQRVEGFFCATRTK